MVDRAKILLYKEQGDYYVAIAGRKYINIKIVKRCIDKNLEGGIERALYNDRLGHDIEITDDAMPWLQKYLESMDNKPFKSSITLNGKILI